MEIPKYNLKNFRKVHRTEDAELVFGHNKLDPARTISGFELYSGDGVIATAGPLRSEFYRVSIGVSGKVDMQIGLDHYVQGPKTLGFTFPNQIFSKHAHNATGYYILFDADFLNDIVPSIKIGDEFPFYNLYEVPVFDISDEELNNIVSLVMKMDEEIQGQRSGREKAIKMYLYLLLLEAKRSYERQNIGNMEKALSEGHKLANRFRKLVSQHYLTRRQVSDYAEMLGVSANHLNKTVKVSTGQTASEAIHEMLVQEAKSLLRYSESSAAEIAYKLDFSDPATFNRFFKRMTSETPQAFRAKHN